MTKAARIAQGLIEEAARTARDRLERARSAARTEVAEDVASEMPTLSLPVGGMTGDARVPTVLRVETDPLTYLFNAFGNDPGQPYGWSGADGTYSVALPDGRVLWIFSDTMVGSVHPDGSRPPLGTEPGMTAMPRNALVIQEGERLTTVNGSPGGRPANVVESHWAFPEHPGAVMWAGDAHVHDGRVEIVYRLYVDDRYSGAAVAEFALDDLESPRYCTPLETSSRTTWGSALHHDGEYAYVYGTEDLTTEKHLRVARTSGSLVEPWEFYAGGNQWSQHEDDGVRVLSGVANEFSVSPVGDSLLLVTHDNSEAMSPNIVGYAAASPVGPFVDKTILYSTPEHGPTGRYGLPGVYTYNAHAHPHVDRGRGRLVVSYNVNSTGSRMVGSEAMNDVEADASIYRPRFVTVQLDI
ncbi:MAG TPA: hypothetical protein VIP77_17060 [Jiangellaceae bacterium]